MTTGLMEASTFSPDVDAIFKSMLAISSVIVIVVWIGMIYFCVKYRHGSAAHRGHPPKNSVGLEVGVISLIMAFGFFIFLSSTKIFYKMRNSPGNAIEVDVIAKQWMWIFHDAHLGDQINMLKVPIGRPVRLVMTSKDVIHSFFVPAFRVKQDVLPGRYTTLWFQATRLGQFEVLCSQYCGLSHSQMRAVVDVVSQDEYDHPTQGNPVVDSELDHGRSLFTLKGCIACHDGQTPIGPSLRQIYHQTVFLADGSSIVADENYLLRSLLEPNSQIVKGYQPVMPTFQGQLTEEEVLALIRYIKSKEKGDL
jgi:cytochrome c oxidase subunit 2